MMTMEDVDFMMLSLQGNGDMSDADTEFWSVWNR